MLHHLELTNSKSNGFVLYLQWKISTVCARIDHQTIRLPRCSTSGYLNSLDVSCPLTLNLAPLAGAFIATPRVLNTLSI